MTCGVEFGAAAEIPWALRGKKGCRVGVTARHRATVPLHVKNNARGLEIGAVRGLSLQHGETQVALQPLLNKTLGFEWEYVLTIAPGEVQRLTFGVEGDLPSTDLSDMLVRVDLGTPQSWLHWVTRAPAAVP